MRPDQLVHNTDMNIILYCRWPTYSSSGRRPKKQASNSVREGVRRSFGAVLSRVTVAGSVESIKQTGVGCETDYKKVRDSCSLRSARLGIIEYCHVHFFL